jgi:hypothetical protein
MTTSREHRWRLIATLTTALLLGVVSGILAYSAEGAERGRKLLVFAVLSNLTSSLIVFGVGSSLLGKESEHDPKELAKSHIVEPLKQSLDGMAGTLEELQSSLRELQGATTLGQIDWPGLIAGASEIDFVVQGWDRWIEAHASSIRSFLDRGGKFRLFVYDPTSNKSNQARALMADRLGKTPHEIESEIRGTTDTIKMIQDELPPAKRATVRLEVFLVTKINWYFAARFVGRQTSDSAKNRDAIVFSIYSHTKHRVNDMPAITLFPEMHPPMNTWFEKELDHLKRR